MTNHWVDMQHSKAILVEGSNVAENHPMAFKWIRKAQENGAVIIHVDPRYTRTSATADIYARIRPGADAAFLNTMINHILVNELYDEDYVVDPHEREVSSATPTSTSRTVCSADSTRRSTSTTPRAGDISSTTRANRGWLESLGDPQCIFTRLRKYFVRATRSRSASGSPASRPARSSDRGDDGQEPARHDPLRARDDAAHDGRAGHPCVHDPAAPARQHRQARQRRQRAARRAERAGRMRHGACSTTTRRATSTTPTNAEPTLDALDGEQRDARRKFLSTCSRRSSETPRPPRTTSATSGCPRGTPRRTTASLPIFEDALAGIAEALVDRSVRIRRSAAQPEARLRGAWQARDARGPGALGDRDRGVLEAAGRRSEDHPDRSPPATGRVLHGEERHHHELGRRWCSGGTPP